MLRERGRRWLIIGGLDPGTENAGASFLKVNPYDPSMYEWLGIYQLRAGGPHFLSRTDSIAGHLDLMAQFHRPDLWVTETVYIKRSGPRINAQSSLQLAKGVGVLLAVAQRYGEMILECQAATLRKLLGQTTANYLGMRLLLQEIYPELQAHLQEVRRNAKGEEEFIVTDDEISSMVQAHVGRLLLTHHPDRLPKGINIIYERTLHSERKKARKETPPEWALEFPLN